jgi:hypothetical protein
LPGPEKPLFSSCGEKDNGFFAVQKKTIPSVIYAGDGRSNSILVFSSIEW